MSFRGFLFFLLIAYGSSSSLMSLFLLDDADAVCNDGSPAGYYLSQAISSRTWVIHLQGGGFCFDLQSCLSRNASSPNLMSSVNWKSTMYGSGIISNDAEKNKYWYDANHVFIPYCSSDSFSGANRDGIAGWKFMGRAIVRSVFETLMQEKGLDKAEIVLFTGSSAGAEGLYPNIDDMRALFSPQVNFKGLLDSGWFMDYEPFQSQPCHNLGDCTEQMGLQRGVKIWNPVVNRNCMNAKDENTLWQCMLGYHAYPFIDTPMFVLQYQFDSAQMGHDGIFHLPTGDSLPYAQQSAQNLTRTFESAGVTTYFSPSCYFHTIIRNSHWVDLKISEQSLPDVFHAWVTTDAKITLSDKCSTPNCNPSCP